MKRIISFDLDGTLVDSTYGDIVWNTGVPEAYARLHSMSLDEARKTVVDQYRAVGDTNLLWYHIEHWLDKFGLALNPEELLHRYETHIQLLPGAREVLEKLSRQYTLVIASNAARIFVEKELSFTGISPHFTRIISATSDYRIVKKGERFYRRLCSDLQVTPEEIVHIGDHPLFDYDAPRSIGIDAYWLMDQRKLGENEVCAENTRKIITALGQILDYL